MEIDKYKIEKFNGKNDFRMWQARVRAILVQEDTHLALTPENIPPKMDAALKARILAKAHSTLTLNLGDEVLRTVVDLTSAVEVWQKLEESYITKLSSSRLLLIKRLYSFKMRLGTNLEAHLNEFNKILLDLSHIDQTPTDEHQAIILLCSLTKAYEGLVDSMLYCREKLTLQAVVDALNSREIRMIEEPQDTLSGASFMRKQVRGGWVPKVIKCFACHEEGHLKRDCPQRKVKAAADVQSLDG